MTAHFNLSDQGSSGLINRASFALVAIFFATVNMPAPKQPRKRKKKVCPQRAVPKENNYFTRMWRERREEMLTLVRTKAHPKAGRPMHVADGQTKDKTERLLAKAQAFAEKVVQKMEDEGILPEQPTDTLLEDDRNLAKEALKEAVVIMRMKGNIQTKLAAARTILEWTRAKPVTKVENTIRTAESFLEELASKN